MCVDRYGVLATATNLQFTRGIILPVFHKYGESKTKSDCQEQCLHYASKKKSLTCIPLLYLSQPVLSVDPKPLL